MLSAKGHQQTWLNWSNAAKKSGLNCQWNIRENCRVNTFAISFYIQKRYMKMWYINVKTWSNDSKAWDIVTWNLFIAEPGNVKLESISTEMWKLRFQLSPVSCKLDRQHDERRDFIFCLTSCSLSGNQQLKVLKLYFGGCGRKLTITSQRNTMMKQVIKCIFTKAGEGGSYQITRCHEYQSTFQEI